MSNLPKKSKIVRWWDSFFADQYKLNKDILRDYPTPMWIDIGEPDCWACGRHDPYFGDISIYLEKGGISEEEDKKGGDKYLWEMWDRASLERHHIVAKSRGGLDTPDNLALLCRDCHRAAPHTSDPVLFWHWAKARQQDVINKYLTAFNQAVESAEINLDTERKYPNYILYILSCDNHPLHEELMADVWKILTVHPQSDSYSNFRDTLYCALKVAKSKEWTSRFLAEKEKEWELSHE